MFLDTLIQDEFYIDMAHKDGRSRIKSLFVSYQFILRRNAQNWLTNERETTAVTYVLPAARPVSFQLHVPSELYLKPQRLENDPKGSKADAIKLSEAFQLVKNGCSRRENIGTSRHRNKWNLLEICDGKLDYKWKKKINLGGVSGSAISVRSAHGTVVTVTEETNFRGNHFSQAGASPQMIWILFQASSNGLSWPLQKAFARKLTVLIFARNHNYGPPLASILSQNVFTWHDAQAGWNFSWLFLIFPFSTQLYSHL